MGTKYSSVSVSGYNSSPPADDGSTAASNQVKWSTIKTKLPDPLKTAIESINSALVTALDQSVRLVSASDSAAATDHDKTIVIGSTITAAVTITLADAATMAAGYVVTVFNASSTVACTIGRATASNTINGATSDYTLPPLNAITFIVASPATGYVTKSRSLNMDSSGNLLINTNTPLGKVTAYAPGTDVALSGVTTNAAYSCIELRNRDASGNNLFTTFYTEGGDTSRGTIDFNRAGVAVRYNTTSDGRLKVKNGPARYDPQWIHNVAASIFDVTWKETGYRVDTFVAQDLYQVEPDAVKVGDDAPEIGEGSSIWGVDQSKLIAKLILEVESIRNEFDAYKASHP